jgi:hypothetical protein
MVIPIPRQMVPARRRAKMVGVGPTRCLAQGVTHLPIDQIRQTVHPTADQEAALPTMDIYADSAQPWDYMNPHLPKVPKAPRLPGGD